MVNVSRGKIIKRTWRYCEVHGAPKKCGEAGCKKAHKRVAYLYDVAVDSRRVRKQFTNKQEAQDALDAFREEARNPAPVVEAKPTLTLSQAFERYFQAKRKRSLAEDQRTSGHLKAEFGKDTPLGEITASRIAEYKNTRLATKSRQTGALLSAASINRPLALLRHVLRLAHEEWEVLDVVPRVRLEREPQGRLRWLTTEDASRLLDACRKSQNPGLADLVEFALFTGLRQGEALGLTWDRVDRARGVIRLEVTKGGKRREVPLSANADAVLARRWSEGAVGFVFGSSRWSAFQSAWEVAVGRAKLDDFRFHDLRHTFASWLVQRGRTIKEVQESLGHRTIAMTMRYAHLAPDHLRAAVAALDGVLGARTAHESTAEVASEDRCAVTA